MIVDEPPGGGVGTQREHVTTAKAPHPWAWSARWRAMHVAAVLQARAEEVPGAEGVSLALKAAARSPVFLSR